VAGLLKRIIGVGVPVVAVLSLFIDIKSAASDVRFRGECVAKLDAKWRAGNIRI
jgi:hypothetical protein